MKTEKIYSFRDTNTHITCNASAQIITITSAANHSEICGGTECCAFFDLIKNCLQIVALRTPLPALILERNFRLKTHTEKGSAPEDVSFFTLDAEKTLHLHSAYTYLHLSYALLKNIFASEAYKAFYAG